MISRAIAALADSALLLPASALLAAYLAALRQGRLLLAWLAALALAGTATVAAKLVFHACGPRLAAEVDVVSPSGHASFAAIFYGALALLVGARARPAIRGALLALAALLVAAVGVSRVRTGAHSVEEVLIGTAIGTAALAAFALLHRRLGRPAVPVAPVAAGFAAALAVLGGLHFSLEHAIGRTARRIADRLDVCAPAERAPAPGLDLPR